MRPVAGADLAAAAAIYRHYVETSTVTFDETAPDAAAWEEKRRRAAELGLPFLVAEDAGGEMLGFAYALPWKERSAYRFTAESTIYLRPDAVGRGVGSLLLGELIAAAAAAGLRELIAVLADEGAEASMRLHERFGFQRVGALPRLGFKFGRWIGIVLLQRSLG